MQLSKSQLWERFQKHYVDLPALGLAVDPSRVQFPDDFFERMEPRMQQAFKAMLALEQGTVANPDENRMVGHYWLRQPALAPTPALRHEIEDTFAKVKAFAADVHSGKVKGAKGALRNLLVIGIGGSALGPQFVAHALSHPSTDRMKPFFFDNTDPDGMEKVLSQIGVGEELGRTLAVVISKSGGTKETRNGMVEAATAWTRAGLDFSAHAVAITGLDSELDRHAVAKGWLRRFPMWDWVGGRTSELSAVGLLPAALQGFDVDSLLAGARACDEVTRQPVTARNPAAVLALLWFSLGDGRGGKDMVVLPYKDRLELFSRYLQQLVMESLGKELDLQGKVVNQGLSVYGNKGSTDQHAYVQQLREGVLNFFAVFIEVLQDRAGTHLEVEPGITSGDYLNGFLLGTREALYEKGRQSITLTVRDTSPFSIGMLIALFERTVGFYASLIGINAYHQPGVEAGKKAASSVIALQGRVRAHLAAHPKESFTAAQLAAGLGAPDAAELVFKLCEHLAANPGRGVKKTGGAATAAQFSLGAN
jgi:glucose-6-phosphate isomerase